MTDIETTEAPIKPLRPDQRREVTDAAHRVIVMAEYAERIEKTRRLQAARLAAKTVR